MKKVIVILVLLIVVAFALFADKKPADPSADAEITRSEPSAGSGFSPSDSLAVVRPADLSDQMKQIIGALGFDTVQVFDLIRHENRPVATHAWVEVFEHGEKKQNDLLNFSASGAASEQAGDGGESQAVFAYKTNSGNKEGGNPERHFDISAAVIDGNGSVSSKSEVTLPENPGGRIMAPLNAPRELSLNRPVTVITVIEDHGNAMSYSAGEILKYDETGEVPETLRQYDRVILFRIMLEKESN